MYHRSILIQVLFDHDKHFHYSYQKRKYAIEILLFLPVLVYHILMKKVHFCLNISFVLTLINQNSRKSFLCLHLLLQSSDSFCALVYPQHMFYRQILSLQRMQNTKYKIQNIFCIEKSIYITNLFFS